jgi:hypothetical protein
VRRFGGCARALIAERIVHPWRPSIERGNPPDRRDRSTKKRKDLRFARGRKQARKLLARA